MNTFKYVLLLVTSISFAQEGHTIKGWFPEAGKKEIQLKGYGFNDMPLLANAVADSGGNFTLNYSQDYTGAALLEVKGAKSVIVLLNKENFVMDWPSLDDFSTLKFKGSAENDAFSQGMAIYRDADAKKAALSYLIPLYAAEPQKQQFFTAELRVQDNRMHEFLGSLPPKSYAGYYLTLRRLLAELPQTASRYLNRVPQYQQEFNAIDFSDGRLTRSGLYKELLDGYFIVLESYDTQKYTHINASADAVAASLKNSPGLKQDVAEYLFKFFEKRSLFPAAENLAVSMLNDTGCKLDAEREALFEQYRKMAKGNTAPDIVLLNATKPYKMLSDVKSKYRLVVFGAGWCPTCKEEAPKLKASYKGWKARGLEIVYISLDTDKSSFNVFTAGFPWVSASDFKSWEGKAARDYYVSGTPTMYLLDAQGKIVLKPVSADQLSAWMDADR